MDQMQDENIVNILQHMGLPERLSFAQVNSRFNKIASTKLLWRDVALTITETQLLLRVGSKYPPSPVSDISVYSKYFGELAHSLDLTINIPFGYDECAHVRVEQIVNALKLVNLQTLTLRLPDFCNMYRFEAFFNAIKSSLRKFDVSSRFPNVSMHFVREVYQTQPPELRELSWMHEHNRTRPPGPWLTSLMLEAIEEDSKKICWTQKDFDELCDTIKLCGKLKMFQTNLLTNSLLEAFFKMIKLRTFSFVLVVNEASIVDGSWSEECCKTLEECRNVEVVLQVTSLDVVSAIRKLPTALPVKKLQLKVTNAQSFFGVSVVIRVAMDKFPKTLRSIYLDINKGTGTMEAETVAWIRKTFPQLIVSA